MSGLEERKTIEPDRSIVELLRDQIAGSCAPALLEWSWRVSRARDEDCHLLPDRVRSVEGVVPVRVDKGERREERTLGGTTARRGRTNHPVRKEKEDARRIVD